MSRAIEAFRASLKTDAQARGVKLTALAFQVKALARCLREFPRFNASLTPDGETLVLKDYVHIGIAVDTPHGLMVPVIRDADRKGLWRIAAEIADLAARAQERKVGPDEMGGASMTISNLGGIGGTAFTPIVNPPEVAILGITRTETVTVWEGDTPRAGADGAARPQLRPPRDQRRRRRALSRPLRRAHRGTAPPADLTPAAAMSTLDVIAFDRTPCGLSNDQMSVQVAQTTGD